MAVILSVDDSASLRQMLMITLQNAGHQVVSAEDGRTAFELAQQYPFDLILSDFNMPLLDGPGLIKALRAEPAYQHTPMLLLTTEDAPEKKQLGKTAGATGWLRKPVDAQQLLMTIDRLLN